MSGECRGEWGQGHRTDSGAWCRVCGKNLAWEDTWHFAVLVLLGFATALVVVFLIVSLAS